MIKGKEKCVTLRVKGGRVWASSEAQNAAEFWVHSRYQRLGWIGGSHGILGRGRGKTGPDRLMWEISFGSNVVGGKG